MTTANLAEDSRDVRVGDTLQKAVRAAHVVRPPGRMQRFGFTHPDLDF